MDLIVTDATGKPVASHASYTLDLAFGSGENDFDLQVEDAALKAGSRIMIDGTEYGGIIDDTDVDVDGGLSTVTWHGRDWHGVLASKIIEPDRNNSDDESFPCPLQTSQHGQIGAEIVAGGCLDVAVTELSCDH